MSPVAMVASIAAATMVRKVVSGLAWPAIPVAIALAIPAIATTGTSWTTDTAPAIGLRRAATTAMTMVEKRAMPIAAGRKSCSSTGRRRLPKLIERTMARKPHTAPAIRSLKTRSTAADGSSLALAAELDRRQPGSSPLAWKAAAPRLRGK